VSRRPAAVVVALTGLVIVAMDWVPTPLNRNIAFSEPAARVPGSVIHGCVCAAVCLLLARQSRWHVRWAAGLAAGWFALVLASAILNWWVPYVAGRYPGEIDPVTYAAEYASNVRVLPAWPGHPVVPDLQHLLIHALLLGSLVACAATAARSPLRPARSAEPAPAPARRGAGHSSI